MRPLLVTGEQLESLPEFPGGAIMELVLLLTVDAVQEGKILFSSRQSKLFPIWLKDISQETLRRDCVNSANRQVLA